MALGSLPTSRRELRARFGLDVRALAALRVAIALLVLADLLLRARDLRAHYTDAGVLPRTALRELFPGFASVSIHALSGALWAEAVVFVVAGVFALTLLVGYRTRLATLASFLLLVSLHARNPVLLNAGDALLRRLLFWGLFLPLGGRWSIDALRSTESGRVTGPASVALLVQVVLVYLVNGLLKLRGDAWPSGEATRIVFGLDHLTILLGDYLAGFPLLGVFDRLWLAMVLASPFLVLLAGRTRAAFAAGFALTHLGMFLTLRLGLFPLVSIAALLVFFPSTCWDRIERRLDGVDSIRSLGKRLDRGLPGPASTAFGFPEWASRARTAVVALAFAFLLVWNAAALGYVTLPGAVTSTVDPGERRWDMFAPEPRSVDGWYVIPGTSTTGERVDAFRGGEVSWARPRELASTFPTHRWFVYLLDLQRPGGAPLREHFAAYLCAHWNRTHESGLANLTIYYVEESPRPGDRDPRRRNLGTFACGR